MTGRLDGKVAIVTGAASGIGFAVARAFAENGATLYGIGHQEDALIAAMNKLEAAGLAATAITADVSNEADIDRAFSLVAKKHDTLDVLANIAGVLALKPIEETTAQIWDWIMAVNMRGTFLCARAATKMMKPARSGSIISTSSNAGVSGWTSETAYCASKHAIEGFSKALAIELNPFGIAVNTITPGIAMRTEMTKIASPTADRNTWRDPAVIAPAYVHLAGQNATGINGQYVNAWELSEILRSNGWS